MACEKFHMRNLKIQVVHSAIRKSGECLHALDERVGIEPGADFELFIGQVHHTDGRIKQILSDEAAA